MNETSNTHENVNANRVLSAGICYTIGKFLLILNEGTGDLKITAHTDEESLYISPCYANSIILHVGP